MTYLLHGYLRASAEHRPEHPAVVMGGRSVSYRELDELSDRVAAALGRAGVRRGDRVALFSPKSVGTVAAIYGAMKAGAAYVPIDPSSPAPRAGYIARDCDVAALVADADRRGVLEPELPGLRVVLDVAELDDLAPAVPDASAPVDTDLAYILYTSGSTGQPKGVMLSHRNALTFVEWATATLGLGREDRFSSHAPFHFDLSVFDLYASAKVGGTLFPLEQADMGFGESSAAFVERHGLTVWYSVPSALVMWVTQGGVEPAMLRSLRHVVFAGEVFPTPYIRRLAGLVPGAALHNWYGPTETNVCTFHDVVPEDVAEGRDETIPIGRSCENYDCFAVTPAGGLATAGEEGELFVRGSGVMRGYWGDPDRTAQVLVPHPVDAALGGPCYRTGDLVVPREDGAFRFVGRRDHQVKTRGYRVELGEVEAAIHAHPSVQEACVLAVPDERIGHALLAYVSVVDGGSLSATELKRHVSERLPRYMVPAEVRFETVLPRTSTGKVDRQALGARTEPGQAAPGVADEAIARSNR